jgi:hypothetical protein
MHRGGATRQHRADALSLVLQSGALLLLLPLAGPAQHSTAQREEGGATLIDLAVG